MHRKLSKQNRSGHCRGVAGGELEEKDVHCKEWECIIENFTEEEADTTVHQIYGQRATLSVNYKPGDWESVRAWMLKSGIRLASSRNSRGSAEYEQVRSRVTRSGHSAPYQVDALGSICGGANATVAASVAS